MSLSIYCHQFSHNTDTNIVATSIKVTNLITKSRDKICAFILLIIRAFLFTIKFEAGNITKNKALAFIWLIMDFIYDNHQSGIQLVWKSWLVSIVDSCEIRVVSWIHAKRNYSQVINSLEFILLNWKALEKTFSSFIIPKINDQILYSKRFCCYFRNIKHKT